MGKLDNMKMGHVSREMETLSENQEDRIKAKNTREPPTSPSVGWT